MAAGPGTDEAGTDDATDLRRTLEGLLGVAATAGNRVDVLRNGDAIFPAMLDAIRSTSTPSATGACGNSTTAPPASC